MDDRFTLQRIIIQAPRLPSTSNTQRFPGIITVTQDGPAALIFVMVASAIATDISFGSYGRSNFNIHTSRVGSNVTFTFTGDTVDEAIELLQIHSNSSRIDGLVTDFRRLLESIRF